MPEPEPPDSTSVADTRKALDSAFETIERAAVRYDGRIFAVPHPGGHNDVLRSMTAAGYDGLYALGGVFGFITSKGRFVDRRAARVIARVAGQIRGSGIKAELFIGDFW
jgi:hypothetical protein